MFEMLILKKQDRLPKWASIGLIISGIISVMIIGYVLHHPEEQQTTIGTTERLNETIDNNWNNGVQGAYGFSDIIPAHPPFEIVQQGNSKEIQVFLKLNVEPSGRMTIHCNWDSCNIRNATNYIYDTLMEDNYHENQTVKIMVNNGYTVFNGTVYDLRG